MLVMESGHFDGWDVEVYGIRHLQAVLATARRAEYGASALPGDAHAVLQRGTSTSGQPGRGPASR